MAPRVLIPLLFVLALAGCGSGNSPAYGPRGMDRHLDGEIDAMEASLKQARDSAQERDAISEMTRKCMDLELSPTIAAYDSTGTQIPINEWDKHRDRLAGARVEIEFLIRDPGLTRTIKHTLIDPENFVYFLMGE